MGFILIKSRFDFNCFYFIYLGKICLPLLKPTEGWKLIYTLSDVIDAVIKLIDDPPRIDEAHCKG
jgi:ubiquitin-protein ligase